MSETETEARSRSACLEDEKEQSVAQMQQDLTCDNSTCDGACNYTDVSEAEGRPVNTAGITSSNCESVGMNKPLHIDPRMLASDTKLVSKHAEPVRAENEQMGEEENEEAAVQAALQSFVRAVHDKYKDDFVNEEILTNAVYYPKQGPVKMTASGNIVLPRQVSMSGQEISVAGDPELIKRMCQRVSELDLMDNHITSWDEVFCLIQCIPNLTFLNLTKNFLTSDLPDLQGLSLPCLTHLVLNDTMITWDVLLELLSVFRSITELHLSLNGFTSVDIPCPTYDSTSQLSPVEETLPTYPALKKLCFVGNKVVEWSEVQKLGFYFSNLETLLISETDLQHLSDNAEEMAAAFPSLGMLGLSRTGLVSWEEVGKLRHFPALTEVALNGIPFLEALPEKFRRQMSIALLPDITVLNRSPVLEAEREDAERAYIRLYLDQEEKPQRYYELEEQHGKLDPLVKVELKPKKTVHLKISVEGPDQVIQSEFMDIDVTLTMKELRKLLSNVAGRPATKIQLYFKDSYGFCNRLHPSDRKVFTLSPQDGEEITIFCPQ